MHKSLYYELYHNSQWIVLDDVVRTTFLNRVYCDSFNPEKDTCIEDVKKKIVLRICKFLADSINDRPYYASKLYYEDKETGISSPIKIDGYITDL